MVHIKSPISGQVARLVRQVEIEKLVQTYRTNFDIDVEDILKNSKYLDVYECLQTGYRFYYPFTVSGDGEFYQRLEKFDWYYMNEKWEHNQVTELINPKHRVLEIGCGEGAFLTNLKNRGFPHTKGLELNKAAALKAKQMGIDITVETIETFSKSGKQFDVVCSFQVLEHIAEVKSFLASSLECLSTGGRLFVGVPNNDSFIKWDLDDVLNAPPHHMGLWNENSLRNLSKFFPMKCLEVRFEPLQTYHVDWFTRILLSKFFSARIYHKVVARSLFEKGIKYLVTRFRPRIKGHTVICIFEKK